MASLFSQCAFLAITGDATHHQLRVQCLQGVVATAHVGHHAGAESINQHIRFGSMIPQSLNALGRAKVRSNNLFAAVQSGIQHGHAFGVIPVWGFHLDDRGTHLLQDQ